MKAPKKNKENFDKERKSLTPFGDTPTGEPIPKMKVSKETMIKILTEPVANFYKIEKDLGHGSYGQVKKVRHKELNEIRAMKITNKKSESSKDETIAKILEGFKQEDKKEPANKRKKEIDENAIESEEDKRDGKGEEDKKDDKKDGEGEEDKIEEKTENKIEDKKDDKKDGEGEEEKIEDKKEESKKMKKINKSPKEEEDEDEFDNSNKKNDGDC